MSKDRFSAGDGEVSFGPPNEGDEATRLYGELGAAKDDAAREEVIARWREEKGLPEGAPADG